jgi:hypothetical protein
MEETLRRPELTATQSNARPNANTRLISGTFSALVLGSFGAVLMIAVALQSRYYGFLVYSLPGVWIAVSAGLRYRRFKATAPIHDQGKLFSLASIGPLVLLLGSGAVLGWLLRRETFLDLGIAVCCFAWLPWHRLQFHRRYLTTSVCLVAAGVVLAWLPFARQPAPIILAAMGWFVSMGACLAFVKGK